MAPGTTISAALANEFTEAVGDLYTSSLIALGLILFAIIFTITLIQRRLFGSAPSWCSRVTAAPNNNPCNSRERPAPATTPLPLVMRARLARSRRVHAMGETPSAVRVVFALARLDAITSRRSRSVSGSVLTRGKTWFEWGR